MPPSVTSSIRTSETHHSESASGVSASQSGRTSIPMTTQEPRPGVSSVRLTRGDVIANDWPVLIESRASQLHTCSTCGGKGAGGGSNGGGEGGSGR